MSNKSNMMNHEYRDWILNERTKIVHGQNKVILPRLAAEDGLEHPHPRRSLRKRDEDSLSKNIKEVNLVDSGRYKHKGEARNDASRILKTGSESGMETRSMREQKAEVVREMKGWIKAVEAAGKEGAVLPEISLPKLENAIYKWCLFIQQNFSCYQKPTQNIPTPRDTPLLKTHRNPEDPPRPPTGEGNFKQQREIYQREIRRLSMRVQETEEQIEANRVYSVQSLGRVAELQRLFVELSQRAKRDVSRGRDQSQAVDALLAKNQHFLQDLKQTLAQNKDISASMQKIEEKLKHLNDYKSHQGEKNSDFYL